GRRTLAIDELRIGRGEVFAILGPNGAGKSTLLKSCLGFVRPRRGVLNVLGQPVTALGGTSLCRLRRRVGYLPQTLTARSEMPLSVREVVATGRTGIAGLFRRFGRDDWRIVDDWLDRLGLGPLRHNSYGELSGGEQRKTLIATAMVQEPEMLLLDEPTANLDLYWREQIVDCLDQLYADQRLTILLVCHELEVIPRCCRRLLVLDHGCPVACGSPGDVLTDARIAGLYGPGLRVVHAGGRHAVVPGGRDEP
ncbi:MAG: ATP-binding cassette domain-containing protein, partial [Pirellulales bacterium]|nr:ATP-binding cassette domain-containing protein [Pirellulales bacterium]